MDRSAIAGISRPAPELEYVRSILRERSPNVREFTGSTQKGERSVGKNASHRQPRGPHAHYRNREKNRQ